MRRPSYLLKTPDELIALPENMKALNIYELEALDEAWHKMFGERIVLLEDVPKVAKSSAPQNPEPEPADDTIIHLRRKSCVRRAYRRASCTGCARMGASRLLSSSRANAV